MVDPGHYQVLPAAGFDDDLAAIEVVMRLMGGPARHEQVNQHIARLDDLRLDPRHRRHWTQWILVYRDEAGSVVGREKVADDAGSIRVTCDGSNTSSRIRSTTRRQNHADSGEGLWRSTGSMMTIEKSSW